MDAPNGADPGSAAPSLDGGPSDASVVLDAAGPAPLNLDAGGTSVDSSVAQDSGGPSTGPDGSDGEDASGGSDARDANDTVLVNDNDASTEDAGDSGCTPPGGDLAQCGVASATTTYSSGYGASLLIDGVLTTSWYAATGACPSNACPGDSVYAEVTLDKPRTVDDVKMFGNRDAYPSGYDVLTAKIELLDSTGATLYSANVTTSRGPEPNGDADQVISPAVGMVSVVRVVVLTGESDGPGFAEIEVFGS
jgi:hypothetical protein